MSKKQSFELLVMAIFLCLLGAGIWVTGWYLSVKLFLTAFIALGAGVSFLSISEEKNK